MKVDVYHEGLHVRSYEDSLLTGSRPLTEDDVARAEVEHVKKTYGDEGFTERGRRVLADYEKFKKADAVAGDVVLLWLREYFEEEQARYTALAFPIPPDSESANRIRKAQDSTLVERVATLYRVAFNLDPSLIFKHCLRKTNQPSSSWERGMPPPEC